MHKLTTRDKCCLLLEVQDKLVDVGGVVMLKPLLDLLHWLIWRRILERAAHVEVDG